MMLKLRSFYLFCNIESENVKQFDSLEQVFIRSSSFGAPEKLVGAIYCGRKSSRTIKINYIRGLQLFDKQLFQKIGKYMKVMYLAADSNDSKVAVQIYYRFSYILQSQLPRAPLTSYNTNLEAKW